MNGKIKIEPTWVVNTREEFYQRLNEYEYDFVDVKGQENIKESLRDSSGRKS